MFIRPIGSVVNPSRRPSGSPLLRGILAGGAYVWDTARQQDPRPPQDTGSGPAAPAEPGPGPAATAPTTPAAGPPDRPVADGTDLTERLTRLSALAREGLLTPEEFTAAKARLLRD